MTSSGASDAPSSPDACPRCGGRLVPVMDGDPASSTGPLVADPPVRLVCPSCPGGAET